MADSYWVSSKERLPLDKLFYFGWREGEPVKVVRLSNLRVRAACDPEHCWVDFDGIPVMVTHWHDLIVPTPPDLMPPAES